MDNISTISPTWSIRNLERELVDDYIFIAHYVARIVHTENNEYSCNNYGFVKFQRPESLIPYSDVTQEMVIQWIKDALGADRVLQIEESLRSQLREKITPTTASGTPW